MVVIANSKEFLPYELHAVIRDYGVRNPKAVDDVRDEFDDLFRLDLHNQPGSIHLVNLSMATSRCV
jgi:hypothetical protein